MIDSLLISIDKLHKTYGPVPIEFIAIDEAMWTDEVAASARLGDIIRAKMNWRISAPKPTPWRGPYRLTSRNYWAKSNALNTAAVLAKHNRMVFLDDCTLVNEDFLLWHYSTAKMQNDLVSTAGGYKYVYPGAGVAGGILSNAKVHTPGDYRLGKYPMPVPCEPGELFGGNCSFHFVTLQTIDGWDECMDGAQGLEDCLTGVRAGRVAPTWFFPDSVVYQITDEHDIIDGCAQGNAVAEIRNEPSIETSPRTKLFPYKDAQGVVHQMTYNHLPIWALTGHKLGRHRDGINFTAEYDPKLLSHTKRSRSIGNEHSIVALRTRMNNGGSWPLPKPGMRDWRDRQKLSEM